MKLLKSFVIFFLSITIINMLTGCLIGTRHHSSSVVQYLYPNQKEPVETPKIPVLSLPLKVGIAFVPTTSTPKKIGYHSDFAIIKFSDFAITESDKMNLMKEISKHFKKYDFVKSIDIIPSLYLTPNGSFANLDQIRTMFGIDVIALISFDQTQFTDETKASIFYWTIVGAYFIEGEKNDTHTMVDAAVYDIKSHKMLFRAPGISYIKGKSTQVNLSEQMRLDSSQGFKEASNDLVINLKEQLELFKEKVKEFPQDFKIDYKPDYTGSGTGGGSIDILFLIFVGAFGGLRLWTYKKRKA